MTMLVQNSQEGCVDANILWFVRFYGYVVSPKGLDLTQRKFGPCVILRNYDKDKPKTIVIFY